MGNQGFKVRDQINANPTDLGMKNYKLLHYVSITICTVQNINTSLNFFSITISEMKEVQFLCRKLFAQSAQYGARYNYLVYTIV